MVGDSFAARPGFFNSHGYYFMPGMKSSTNVFSFCVMEAAGLGGFVMGAGLLSIFLEHPDLPVMQSSWKAFPLLRRIPLGLIMGGYVLLATVLLGKKSGAHINPAVTWTFFRLGKITLKNALLYTVAQFAGAVLAAQLLKYCVGYWFSHPAIDYGVTAPKPPYTSLHAFAAEAIISFILMLAILLASSSKKWEKGVPHLSGLFIGLFIVFELPFSGMSLNPARSTAGALAAMKFEHLWIYFVSPLIAMLAAAELFLWIQKSRNGSDKKPLPEHPVVAPMK